MKSLLFFLVLICTSLCLPQTEKLDKLELQDGTVLVGKVVKIKTHTVEFETTGNGLIYEHEKKDIRYIKLWNNKILTFEEFNDTKGVDQADSPTQSVQNSERTVGSIAIISISVGYGWLNMTDVNNDLNDSQDLFSDLGLNTNSPDLISGGLFLGGSLKFIMDQWRIGLAGNYISSSGEFKYSDPDGSFEEKYDVSTIEITALVEVLFASQQYTVQPFLRINGGIGLGSVDHKGVFQIFSLPEYTTNVINNVSGNYFSGRVQGGVQFILKNANLELAVGYRIANAGEMKGDHIENGIKFENMPVRDINGNGINFDYSGFLASAGISILL